MQLLSWLSARMTRRRQTRRAAAPKPTRAFRPQLEALEDRWQPSGFGLSGSYAVNPGPQATVTADVNHDGALDLITADVGQTTGTGGVSVLLGQKSKQGTPTGTFGTAQFYNLGPTPSIAVGDINGDPNLDVVTGNGALLLGNGTGGFSAGPSFVGGLDYQVFLADTNGDGKLDIITASQSIPFASNGAINVMLGNGNGTFQAPVTITTPFAIQQVLVGNFDGKLDVVVAAPYNSVYLLPGNGNGTFGTPKLIGSVDLADSNSAQLDALTAADLNGDGKLDLALTYQYLSSTITWTGVSTLQNEGNGTFFTMWDHTIGSAYALSGSVGLAAADVNGDGKLDLITVGPASYGPLVSVLFGAGDGFFYQEVDYLDSTGSVTTATSFAVGDFNGDGTADLALAGNDSHGGSDIDVFFWVNTANNTGNGSKKK
jgi:hypothetical protein